MAERDEVMIPLVWVRMVDRPSLVPDRGGGERGGELPWPFGRRPPSPTRQEYGKVRAGGGGRGLDFRKGAGHRMKPSVAARPGEEARGRIGIGGTSVAPPGAARAAVGDVLPAGRAGGGPAGPVCPEQLGPDPARPVVGPARAGGARRDGRSTRSPPRRRSGRSWRRGRSGRWRSSRRCTPGWRRSG